MQTLTLLQLGIVVEMSYALHNVRTHFVKKRVFFFTKSSRFLHHVSEIGNTGFFSFYKLIISSLHISFIKQND